MLQLVLLALVPTAPPVAPPPRAVQVWEPALTLKHSSSITALAASAHQIAAATDDGTVTLWDARTGREQQTVLTAKDRAAPVGQLRFSPDGEWLFVLSHGGQRCHVCECRKPRAVQVFASTKPFTGGGRWSALALTQGRPRWVLALDGRSLWVHEATTDVTAPVGGSDLLLLRVEVKHNAPINRLDATDETLVTLSGGVLRGWPLSGGSKPWTVTLLNCAPTNLTLSPDGEWVAVTGDEGEVRVYDAQNGQPRPHPRGHRLAAWAAAFAPDSKTVTTASEDQTVAVWDVFTGGRLAVLRGHAGAVTAVTFAPDGRTLVSGSTDKTVKVWTRKP